MDTVTVFTNWTCNQACGFCTYRRSEDDPPAVRAERVSRAIREGAAGGASVLVLSGGEPTLDPGLVDHVALAREAGFATVILETNAMLLAYPGLAERLARAGVGVVRAALNDVGDRSDSVTCTPGGYDLTVAGMRRALEAGLPVEVSVALTRESLGRARALPEAVAAAVPGVRGVVLRVVTEAPEDFVPTYAEAAAEAVAVARAARELGLSVAFDGRHAVPLCFFPERRRYPELFAQGPPQQAHGMRRIEACERCVARPHCPGIPVAYLDRHGADDARPVPEGDTRFVAGLGRDRKAAVERELVNEAWFDAGGRKGLERIVRVNFHCNQACTFCFVDRSLPAVDEARILEEIDRAAADGVELLSLSGGEPTLNPRLAEYVRRATALGLSTQIQTNAVLCARPGYVVGLAEAGLKSAFVSLHGATAAVSDAVTEAPGTFVQTLEGVDRLLEAGVSVVLNFVIAGSNHHELADMVALVADRWDGRTDLNFSWAHASTDLVPVSPEIIPPFSEVQPHLSQAIASCRRHGIRFLGFDGQCGVPLCWLDPSWAPRESLAPVPPPNPPRGFLKTEACRSCALDGRCVGLRETYASLYGSGELSPVH